MDHGLAASNLIQPMQYMGDKPLRIERDWGMGHEVIIIEGARFDAEFFRSLALPDPGALYAICRDEDVVILKTIRNAEEARAFFEQAGGE